MRHGSVDTTVLESSLTHQSNCQNGVVSESVVGGRDDITESFNCCLMYIWVETQLAGLCLDSGREDCSRLQVGEPVREVAREEVDVVDNTEPQRDEDDGEDGHPD